MSNQDEQQGLIDAIRALKDLSVSEGIDISSELASLEASLTAKKQEKADKSAWDVVELARHKERPTALDFIYEVFDDFIELHGDRQFRDDPALVAGLASLNGRAVTVVAQQKGRNTKENIVRNFGMVNPEGYRKSLRFMKQAEKFGRPIVCFIDTPGAYCGLGAEERGQGEAIAKNLFEMSHLKVPVISIVLAEGGSGGALALGVANRVYMLENAIYSVLSPEGFASILYKDAKKAKNAAEDMKITANDLHELSIIDKVFDEGEGAHVQIHQLAQDIKSQINDDFKHYDTFTKEQLVEERYNKYREF